MSNPTSSVAPKSGSEQNELGSDQKMTGENLIAQLHSSDVTGFNGTTNFDHYFGQVQVGQTLRQPQLATTLSRIAHNGPEEFYTGTTADQLVAQMQRGAVKGLITKADLAGYRAIWRDPLIAKWRG